MKTKFGKQFFEQFSGPVAAVAVNILILSLLIRAVVFRAPESDRNIQVQVIENTRPPELDPPSEPPDTLPPDDTLPVPAEQVSPLPDPSFDKQIAVVPDSVGLTANNVPSPFVIKGLFAGRTKDARSSRLQQFAGGYDQQIDAAVMRSLQWLASQQKPEGFWGEPSVYNQTWHDRPWTSSMVNDQRATRLTALSLLAFLAHGDTPQSEPFGDCVQHAIEYLLHQQNPQTGLFVPFASNRPEKSGEDLGVYAHAQAVYALAEAYALTCAPVLKGPVERGVQAILSGQLDSGAWGNWYEQNIADASATSWQIQALKAAQAAGIQLSELDAAMERAVQGIAYLYKGDGVWYYRKGDLLKAPREGGSVMSGAMVFSLQLLGLSNDPMTLAGLRYLNDFGVTEWNTAWEHPINKSLPATYEWYYNTQAVFQRGGSRWTAWNRDFAPMLLSHQNPSGWWLGTGQTGEEEKIYSTDLCALSLQVYYRILPTSRDTGKHEPTVIFPGDVTITVL